MVERAEIFSKIASIEGHSWAQVEEPVGDQVWEGRQYGATFKISKPEGAVFEDVDISSLYLVLQGKAKGRDRLRQEFVDALGNPTIETPAARFISQKLLWSNSQKA